MPVQLQPPELARLVDYAERPRVEGWSLRSALVRYAQPQPQRVSNVLDLVRRIEFALNRHTKLLERDGESLWPAVTSGIELPASTEATVVGLLRAMVELDRLGDMLAAWAVDRAGERPDAQVDAITTDVARRLEQLGVPREERPGPPRGRGARGV